MTTANQDLDLIILVTVLAAYIAYAFDYIIY